MLQQHRKRILNAEVGKGCEHRRQEEQGHTCHLNAQEQVTSAADYCLKGNQGRQEQPFAQVPLTRGKVRDALIVNLLAQNDQKHEHADPQRHVHKQWRHCRSIGINRVQLFGLQLGRRKHEAGNLFRIQAVFAKQILQGVSGAQGNKIGSDRIDIVLETSKHAIGLTKRGCRGLQRGIKLIEGRYRLIDEQRLVRHRRRKTRKRIREFRGAIA